MSSRLEAVTRGSSWRTAPAAALRGLANSGSPLLARRLVCRSHGPLHNYTPPPTPPPPPPPPPAGLLLLVSILVRSPPPPPSPGARRCHASSSPKSKAL